MIVIDIETSGLDLSKHGIWQIGALDLNNPENIFLEESRIDDEDKIEQEAIKIHGKNEIYLRDRRRQSQENLIKNLFSWTEKIDMKNTICQNPQFDLGFIISKARRYGLGYPLGHRAFDLHSIAAMRYYQIYGKYSIRNQKNDAPPRLKSRGLLQALVFWMLGERTDALKGAVLVGPRHNKSDMGMTNILRLCGLEDRRRYHNALEDARLAAECFSRLVYGKSIIHEYSNISIPEILQNA